MSTNQVSFQIVASGKGGLKVVRTMVGRSVRVYVSRTGSFAQDESACMRYLHRVKVNGMGPAFASVEERENMRAAALAISLQEQKRGQRASDAPTTAMAAFCQMTGIAREAREFDAAHDAPAKTWAMDAALDTPTLKKCLANLLYLLSRKPRVGFPQDRSTLEARIAGCEAELARRGEGPLACACGTITSDGQHCGECAQAAGEMRGAL